MNADQQTRLEIMKALEKDFPDRLLEDLIDVALYVELGGVERARLKESAEKFFATLRHLNPPTPAQDETEPRVWERWEEVPIGVRVTNKVGTTWMQKGIPTTKYNDQFAPFTEVLS